MATLITALKNDSKVMPTKCCQWLVIFLRLRLQALDLDLGLGSGFGE